MGKTEEIYIYFVGILNMQNGFSVWTDFCNWIVRENFMLVGRNLKRAGYNVNVEASDCKRVLNLTQNIWILDPCLFGFTKLNPFFNINLELQFYPKFLHSPIPRKTSSLKYAYHSRRTIFSLFTTNWCPEKHDSFIILVLYGIH